MGMIAQTPPETTGVRSMTFHPDGTHLFSAVQVQCAGIQSVEGWNDSPQPPRRFWRMQAINLAACQGSSTGCLLPMQFEPVLLLISFAASQKANTHWLLPDLAT
eukprot:1160827-Pelagomonas_calceolata.AAC.14